MDLISGQRLAGSSSSAFTAVDALPPQRQTGTAPAADFAVLAGAEEGFETSRPGYRLDFPRDHGAHPAFRIEWWYLTTNLEDAEGTGYGAQWTLFRVATFEDWTDVMYETMVVYPLSWTFYLSFIFLSAFAFLNMIIGIVVNVLEEEHQRQAQADAIAAGEPTLVELRDEIISLRRLMEAQQRK